MPGTRKFPHFSLFNPPPRRLTTLLTKSRHSPNRQQPNRISYHLHHQSIQHLKPHTYLTRPGSKTLDFSNPIISRLWRRLMGDNSPAPIAQGRRSCTSQHAAIPHNTPRHCIVQDLRPCEFSAMIKPHQPPLRRLMMGLLKSRVFDPMRVSEGRQLPPDWA